jgi:protein-S-isoprenylcysteine O-methyltransferase Ste14
MDTTTAAFIACLCLVCFILGMISMSIILHPYRQEQKRMRKSQEEWQRYQQRVSRVNR